MSPGFWILITVLIVSAWIFYASDAVARSLHLKVCGMNKLIGDTVTVTATPAPAGSTASGYSFTADPAVFALVSAAENVAVYTCIAASGGATISATATAVNGSSVSGVSEAIVVAAPVVVATSLTLDLA